jgi:glycosyltransferase involved in cell wall biosynthesis
MEAETVRILTLTDLYPPYFVGGYEMSCKVQMDSLSKRGHDVFVLTSQWGVPRAQVDGRVHRLLHLDKLHFDFYRQRYSAGRLKLAKRFEQIRWAMACRENYRITRALVDSLKPDVVYVWNMKSLGVSPLLGAQNGKALLVFRLDDYWLSDFKQDLCLEPNPLKRRYRKLVVGLKDFEQLDLTHMLVCTQEMKQHHLKYDFAESSMTVIPLCIPAGLLLKSLSPSDYPDLQNGARLVVVGRIVPEKGIDTAIEALRLLRLEAGRCPIQLDIVGGGREDYIEQLRRLVARYGLGDSIRFVGKLERHQVLERFADYHALLFPSRWAEPFGVTLLEAMARGLPIISTPHGVALEAIRDGENGFLVPPDDPQRLAAAITRLVENPDLAHKLRQNGLQTVREHYTDDRITDRVEEYLSYMHQKTMRAEQAPEAYCDNAYRLPKQEVIARAVHLVSDARSAVKHETGQPSETLQGADKS